MTLLLEQFKTVKDELEFGMPPLGTVLHMPGLPGGGATIYDRSPYGNHGAISGAIWTRLPSGLWGLSFDGDDRVDTASALTVDLRDEWTISMWVKQTARPGYTWLYDKLNDNIILGIKDTGELGIWGYVATVWENPAVLGATVLDLNKWYHLLGVNSVVGNFIRVYVNGVQDSVEAVSPGTFDAQTSITRLGTNWDASIYFFTGSMTLPKSYNVALTTAQIADSFNQERHLFGV